MHPAHPRRFRRKNIPIALWKISAVTGSSASALPSHDPPQPIDGPAACLQLHGRCLQPFRCRPHYSRSAPVKIWSRINYSVVGTRRTGAWERSPAVKLKHCQEHLYGTRYLFSNESEGCHRVLNVRVTGSSGRPPAF